MTDAGLDFAELVGEELDEFIRRLAPLKVCTRLENALLHFIKAQKLDGVDDEMGVVRLIAAEEELVVAIFEGLKQHSEQLPKHRDFIKKYKDHRVKQAFYPVLQNMRHLLVDYFRHGITPDGLEGLIHFDIRPVIERDEIKIGIFDAKGKKIIATNALSTEISQDEKSSEEISETLYLNLVNIIKVQNDMTLKEYIASRKDYRNKIFYADDNQRWAMGETLSDLLPHFCQILHDLLWVLALVLGNDFPSRWGVVSQFISVYRRVLVACDVLNDASAC